MTRKLPALAFALVAGCVYENRSSIAITGRAAPSSETSCTFSPGGQNVLGPGVLDVSFGPNSYSTVLYVSNNLTDPSTGNPASVPDAKAWRAESVRVRLNPSSYVDDFTPSPALVPVTGENVLPLDNQVTPPNGDSAQFLDVISPALGQSIASALTTNPQRLVVGITLQGHTLDGARLESGEWFFPIDVCNGCLQPGFDCDPPAFFVSSNCFGIGQDSPPVCACPDDLTFCSNVCVNTQTDVQNCGGCGTVCTAGQTCSAGTCG